MNGKRGDEKLTNKELIIFAYDKLQSPSLCLSCDYLNKTTRSNRNLFDGCTKNRCLKALLNILEKEGVIE